MIKLFVSMMTGEDYDFREKCKMTMVLSTCLAFIGIFVLICGVRYPFSGLNSHDTDFMRGFYQGGGAGLLVASLITIRKQYRYLKDKEAARKAEIYYKDERNRAMGLRCWAYAGYSLLFTIYVAMLVAGTRSPLTARILLVVLGVYGAYLLLFRTILKRRM